MVTFNGLPLYRVALGKQDGVIRVSLVDDPAVQSSFEFFRNAEKAPALYAVQDAEKRIVRGVVLRADFPIYRKDSPDDPGYYVTFSAEVIRAAAERLLAEGRANEVNIQHVRGSDVDGVQMVQLFVKDTAAGIDPAGFDGIADGSLFAEYHVTNDDVWNEIKAGTFKGFSVEIFYTLIPAAEMRRDPDVSGDDVAALLLDYITNANNMALSKLKAALARIVALFGNVTTDKGVLHWDGEEDLKAGDRVQIEDAEGNRSDAPDGEYVTSDGKTIVVVDGAVSEIRDPEAEVAPEDENNNDEEPAAMRRFKAARAAFDESYDEKYRKIADALRAALGSEEFYIAEAGDDFVVACLWDGEGEKFLRFKVTWNEDGTANVSDPKEVKPAFVPVGEDTVEEIDDAPVVSEEEFAQAVNAAERLSAENAALKARVAELEKQPLTKPVREKFNANETGALLPESTGDRGLDRLARIRK